MAEVLARFAGQLGDEVGLEAVPELEPALRSGVVLGVAGVELRQALERSSWRGAPRSDLAARHGYHEALGAMALAVATKWLETGELERVLVLSGSAGSFTATLLGRGRGRRGFASERV